MHIKFTNTAKKPHPKNCVVCLNHTKNTNIHIDMCVFRYICIPIPIDIYIYEVKFYTAGFLSIQSIFFPMPHRFAHANTHELFTIQYILGPTYFSVSDRVIHRLCTLTTQNLAKYLISVCLSIYQAKAAVAAAEVALQATVEANIAAAAAAEISAEVIRLRCVTNTEKV